MPNRGEGTEQGAVSLPSAPLKRSCEVNRLLFGAEPLFGLPLCSGFLSLADANPDARRVGFYQLKEDEMKIGNGSWSIAAAVIVVALALPICTAAQDSSTTNHYLHHRYRLIEIGTFGGPSSSVPGPGVK